MERSEVDAGDALASLTPQKKAILVALLELGEVHIYDLKRHIGGKQAVYGTVERLQLDGMVSARRVPNPDPSRPPRKMVELTAVGRRVAVRVANEAMLPAGSPVSADGLLGVTGG